MIQSFFRFLVWALAATFIVQMGWNEPLSYRFKSPAAIAAEEQAMFPPPAPRTRAPFASRGTALDRGPYGGTRRGSGLYVPGNSMTPLGPVISESPAGRRSYPEETVTPTPQPQRGFRFW